MVELLDEQSMISSQEFHVEVTNTAPYFLVTEIASIPIKVRLNRTVTQNITSIMDKEGNPITIKLREINSTTNTITVPSFIQVFQDNQTLSFNSNSFGELGIHNISVDIYDD